MKPTIDAAKEIVKGYKGMISDVAGAVRAAITHRRIHQTFTLSCKYLVKKKYKSQD